MLAILGKAPWDKTFESTMRRRQKKILHESVGISDCFSRPHWFLEPVSLAITSFYYDEYITIHHPTSIQFIVIQHLRRT